MSSVYKQPMLWWEGLAYKVKNSMQTDSIASPNHSHVFYSHGSAKAKTSPASNRKKVVTTASLVALAIFMLIVFSLAKHAKGEAGSGGSHVSAVSDSTKPDESGNQSVSSSQQGSESGNSSSVNIKLNSSSSSNSAGSTSSSDLTVNGQKVPTNSGNVDYHYSSSDGSTNVNISSNNSSSTGGSTQ